MIPVLLTVASCITLVFLRHTEEVHLAGSKIKKINQDDIATATRGIRSDSGHCPATSS